MSAITLRTGILTALLPLSAFSLLTGCGASVTKEYTMALAHGKQTIPCVREFVSLFPEAKTFYSYYTGEVGPTTWNSVAWLYGRYELRLQVEVTLDRSRTKVVTFAEPRFFLDEITGVSRNPNGSTTMFNNPSTYREFGEEEWRKIAEARGDLTTLGVTIVKDQPVKGLGEYWGERFGSR